MKTIFKWQHLYWDLSEGLSSGVIWKEHPGRRNSRFETERRLAFLRVEGGCGWNGTAQCLQQPSEEFVPENQSAYYSFIKEALLLQKRKKKKLNYSVPCDVIASLMAHILFFFFGFAEIYKEYWRSKFKIIQIWYNYCCLVI